MQVIVAVVAYAILGPGGTFLNTRMGWLVGSGLNIAGGSAAILGAAVGAISGFAGVLINGGSMSDAFGGMLKGAITGMMGGAVASELGDIYGHSTNLFSEGSFVSALKKAILHGIARGSIDAMQGGKFGASFAGGFVSSGFAVSQKWGTVESRTVVMAMVGGATSEITGGKFANGAISGAFVHLF
ncbi:MAG: hypothetical protein IE885_01020, partial [Campylobacterales bacterium]|nr:hypothetical protein [Campylobacterales bacterium]